MKRANAAWWKWLAVTVTVVVFAVSAALLVASENEVLPIGQCRLIPGIDISNKVLLLVSSLVLVWLGVFGVLKLVTIPLRQVTQSPGPDFSDSKQPTSAPAGASPTAPSTANPDEKSFGTASAIFSIVTATVVSLTGLGISALFGVMFLFSLPEGYWEGNQWAEVSWFDQDVIARYNYSAPFLMCPIADRDYPENASLDQGQENNSSPGSDSSADNGDKGAAKAAKIPAQPVVDLDKIPYWLPTPDPSKRVEPDPTQNLGTLAFADEGVQNASGDAFHQIPDSAYAVVELDAAGPAYRQVFAQYSYGKWEVLSILPETAPFKEGELSGLPVANSRGIPQEIKLKFLPRSADDMQGTIDYVSTDGGYTWKQVR